MTVRVPATPVVLIAIDQDTVRVNAQPVATDGAENLHAVAVSYVAQNIAGLLERPVRAIATDQYAKVALIVHPDGTSSNATVLETFDPPTERPARLAPVVPLTPQRSELQVRRDAAARSRPTRVLRISVATVAAGSALAVAFSYAMLNQGDHQAAAQSPATVTPSSSATRPALAPTLTLAPRHRVRVQAQGSHNSVVLRISTVQTPLRVHIRIRSTGPATARERTVTLRSSTSTIRVGGVATGPATWHISSARTPVVSGRVNVIRAAAQPPPKQSFAGLNRADS